MNIKSITNGFLILTTGLLGSARFVHATTNSIVIPFSKVGKKIFVTATNGVCSASGKRPFKLLTDPATGNSKLVCTVREPDFKFDSETPFHLLEKFEYPKTILMEMEASGFFKEESGEPRENIKDQIASLKHKWGTEYFWMTPSKGATRHTYLCPKKVDYCFKVEVGGIETMTFDIK